MPLDQFNQLPSYPYGAEMSIGLQYGIWAKVEGICDFGFWILDWGFWIAPMLNRLCRFTSVKI